MSDTAPAAPPAAEPALASSLAALDQLLGRTAPAVGPTEVGRPAPALATGAADLPALSEMPAAVAPSQVPIASVPTAVLAADPVPASAEALREVAQVANAALAEIARIVSDKPRAKVVPLDWPVAFEGKLYERVGIRRLTAKEVADFVSSLRGDPKAAERRFPMFDVPDAVLDALDDDDMLAVDTAAAGFLPRRWRGEPETADAESI